jgi:hypothetical protein
MNAVLGLPRLLAARRAERLSVGIQDRGYYYISIIVPSILHFFRKTCAEKELKILAQIIKRAKLLMHFLEKRATNFLRTFLKKELNFFAHFFLKSAKIEWLNRPT